MFGILLMLHEFRELLRYRELLMVLVGRDLKVRYKRSVLGFLWSLINPLMQTLVITIVFKVVLKIPAKNYSVWVLAAILPWTFFQNSILDSAQSILIHFSLLKKIYLPREIIPLTTIIANLVHFTLSLVVFFAFTLIALPLFFGVRLYFGPMLLWLPVLVFFQLLLNTGLSLMVAAMNVYYEDVKYIVQILVNLLFYTCPILYTTDRIVASSQANPAHREFFSQASQRLFFYYRLNPMACLIYAYQKVLLSRAEPFDPRFAQLGSWDYAALGIAAVECIGIALIGYNFFNRRKWEFAERL